MRVLHFCSRFSPRSESFLYDFVQELGRQGTEVHVATRNRVNAEERPFPEVTTIDEPNRWHPRRLWHRLRVGLTPGEQSFASTWPQLRDRLAGAVGRVEPDVLHAHFGPAGILAGPVARRAGVPLVVTFYGFDVSRLARDPFWTGHYPEAFANADLLVGISGHICERIEALGGDPDRIERWHLGVDLSRFPHRPPDPGDDPGTVRCLHVGRLVEKKAPLRLVRALRHAQDRLSTERRLHLTVAGDGPLRGALKREIDRLGLNDRVRLLGSVPHERVPGLMAEADLYTQHCVTAGDGEQEGQGVTFVEASATGRPVVATRHNGLPDVVLDGTTGRLVEPGDAEAMGAAIAAFARSPERRAEMGRAGRKHVEARFDLETQTRTMRGLYERVTGA